MEFGNRDRCSTKDRQYKDTVEKVAMRLAGGMPLQAKGSQGLSANTRSWQMKERIHPWSDQREGSPADT